MSYEMKQKRRRDTPQWAWEQALIDAYYDHRWHAVLDPLARAVERWKAGELDHVDLARAALRIRKGTNQLDSLFSEKRDYLVRLIEFDSDWFAPWVATHPRPPRDTPERQPAGPEGVGPLPGKNKDGCDV